MESKISALGARTPTTVFGEAIEVCYPDCAMPLPRPASPATVPLSVAALAQSDALFRVARHLTGHEADAEDLVQETFARALGSHSQFAPGTNVRAWLFRILRNCFIDGYRRGRNSPVLGASTDDERSQTTESTTHDPLRGDRELDRLRTLVAEDIERALATLSVDARAVILFDLEGLTETELAAAMDCSIGTIKSRLSRARASLRVKLSDYSG